MGLFGGKKRILIVDDEASTRSMLTMLLEDAGYEVLEAAAGDTAVTEATEQVPDLIILDINLPQFTGIQVLQLLRGNPKTKAIPIVMCTAHDTLEDVERCLAAGANDYIQKPFDLKGVLTKIQKYLT